MINFLRVFFSFLILLILTPQTFELNPVLNFFHETGFFANYGEAKIYLNFLTWFLIFFFFFFSFV
jgi:hypothetical protein